MMDEFSFIYCVMPCRYWGGWQVPSRGPPVQHLPQNVNHTCQYESNYCYPRWMCSAWGGS